MLRRIQEVTNIKKNSRSHKHHHFKLKGWIYKVLKCKSIVWNPLVADWHDSTVPQIFIPILTLFHSLVVIVADCDAKGQRFNPAQGTTEFVCHGCGKTQNVLCDSMNRLFDHYLYFHHCSNLISQSSGYSCWLWCQRSVVQSWPSDNRVYMLFLWKTVLMLHKKWLSTDFQSNELKYWVPMGLKIFSKLVRYLFL